MNSEFGKTHTIINRIMSMLQRDNEKYTYWVGSRYTYIDIIRIST